MNGTRKYYPEQGNPITKEHTWYILTDKWLLVQKLRIPKIQFTEQMKLKKKDDQSMGTLVLLRRVKKILMEGVTETKYGAETEGKDIQFTNHRKLKKKEDQRRKTKVWILRSFLEEGTKYTWKEIQRQSMEQRLKEKPFRDCPT